ncbi:MAG: polyprenyl synthetase family protein [Acidobacteria bacterium]|jgi:geranylgeranyl pyrophosphate synthase|nr:polyprenyl synthetase family protein [Acidobacteriota bacterium]
MAHGEPLPWDGFQREVDETLRSVAAGEVASGGVDAAWREALLSPGKRVRPILMLLVAGMFSVPRRRVLPLAVIVEMVHAASLVLDDLPCMDDADTRRGRPSLHKTHGEAVATLASFELLSRAHARLPAACAVARLPRRRWAALGDELAHVVEQLCRGQALDLAGTAEAVDELERVHAQKTGSLFVLSARWGALAGRPSSVELDAVEDYARNLGLAFQVMDDVLDCVGDAGRLGKPVGQDASRATFVDLLGLDGARRLADELTATAVHCLAPFGRRGAELETLAREVVSRVR